MRFMCKIWRKSIVTMGLLMGVKLKIEGGSLILGQVKSESSNLLLFFLIAFAWSWLFWFLQMGGLNLYVAPFGPFVAAFYLTFRNEGKQGVKELLKKGFDPRIGKIWYIPIFFLMPIIAGFSLLLAWLSEGRRSKILV